MKQHAMKQFVFVRVVNILESPYPQCYIFLMHYLPAGMPTTPGDVHPFTISSALDVSFGFSPEFMSGKIVWDTLGTSGGGRTAPEATLAKMKELNALTRDGAPLADRQTVLASCWHQHYDAIRIEFITQFLIGNHILGSPKLNKTDNIKKLVEFNAPFIPFTILNEHLKVGLSKFKGKTTFPVVCWESDYAQFCDDVPFDSTSANSIKKSAKLALAIDFWKEATLSHNEDAPAKKILKLTDEEIAKLSGSQFSLSVGGTPEFKMPATPAEAALRAKLLLVTNEFKNKKDKLRQAKEFERKAAELRDSISVSSHSSPSKRKPDQEDDDEPSHPDKGMHALDVFLSATRRKVELADYIDFASMSTTRLKEIKMLNSMPMKSSKIATGLVLRHSLSEADVEILTNDFSQITDGFLFHYLKVVSESNLDDPLAIVMDRLAWWQWMAKVFDKNVAAEVKFIKSFLVEHHREPFWTPLVKLETNLVLLCKEQAPLPSSQKAVKKDSGSKPAGKGGKGNGNRQPHVVLSAPQLKKIESFKARFPTICMSRMVRGRTCAKERAGGVCRFSHNCAWCGSASCKADCAQAELL